MTKKRLGIIIFSVFFVFGLTFMVKAQDENTPYIDSLDPVSGPISTEVSIKGGNFGSEDNAGKVFFYKNKSASVVSWSDEEIICKVPTGAKSGEVIVIDEEGKKSDGVKFKVSTGVLVAPVNLSADNISTKSVTLKWDLVKNDSGYSVSIGTDEQATSLKSTDVQTNSYDKSDLEPNKTYYWKVKAINSSPKKNSGWSRIVSFKTKAEEVKPAPTTQSKKNTISLSTIIIIAALVIVLILAIIVLVRALSRRRRLDLGATELKPEPEEGPLPTVSQEERGLSNTQPGMADISRPQEPSINEPYPPSSTPPSEIPPSEPSSPPSGLPPSEPPSSEGPSSTKSPQRPSSGIGL